MQSQIPAEAMQRFLRLPVKDVTCFCRCCRAKDVARNLWQEVTLLHTLYLISSSLAMISRKYVLPFVVVPCLSMDSRGSQDGLTWREESLQFLIHHMHRWPEIPGEAMQLITQGFTCVTRLAQHFVLQPDLFRDLLLLLVPVQP